MPSVGNNRISPSELQPFENLNNSYGYQSLRHNRYWKQTMAALSSIESICNPFYSHKGRSIPPGRNNTALNEHTCQDAASTDFSSKYKDQEIKMSSVDASGSGNGIVISSVDDADKKTPVSSQSCCSESSSSSATNSSSVLLLARSASSSPSATSSPGKNGNSSASEMSSRNILKPKRQRTSSLKGSSSAVLLGSNRQRFCQVRGSSTNVSCFESSQVISQDDSTVTCQTSRLPSHPRKKRIVSTPTLPKVNPNQHNLSTLERLHAEVRREQNKVCGVCQQPYTNHNELVLLSPGILRPSGKSGRRICRSKGTRQKKTSVYRRHNFLSSSTLRYCSLISSNISLADALQSWAGRIRESGKKWTSLDKETTDGSRLDLAETLRENVRSRLYGLLTQIKSSVIKPGNSAWTDPKVADGGDNRDDDDNKMFENIIDDSNRDIVENDESAPHNVEDKHENMVDDNKEMVDNSKMENHTTGDIYKNVIVDKKDENDTMATDDSIHKKKEEFDDVKVPKDEDNLKNDGCLKTTCRGNAFNERCKAKSKSMKTNSQSKPEKGSIGDNNRKHPLHFGTSPGDLADPIHGKRREFDYHDICQKSGKSYIDNRKKKHKHNQDEMVSQIKDTSKEGNIPAIVNEANLTERRENVETKIMNDIGEEKLYQNKNKDETIKILEESTFPVDKIQDEKRNASPVDKSRDSFVNEKPTIASSRKGVRQKTAKGNQMEEQRRKTGENIEKGHATTTTTTTATTTTTHGRQGGSETRVKKYHYRCVTVDGREVVIKTVHDPNTMCYFGASAKVPGMQKLAEKLEDFTAASKYGFGTAQKKYNVPDSDDFKELQKKYGFVSKDDFDNGHKESGVLSEDDVDKVQKESDFPNKDDFDNVQKKPDVLCEDDYDKVQKESDFSSEDDFGKVQEKYNDLSEDDVDKMPEKSNIPFKNATKKSYLKSHQKSAKESETAEHNKKPKKGRLEREIPSPSRESTPKSEESKRSKVFHKKYFRIAAEREKRMMKRFLFERLNAESVKPKRREASGSSRFHLAWGDTFVKLIKKRQKHSNKKCIIGKQNLPKKDEDNVKESEVEVVKEDTGEKPPTEGSSIPVSDLPGVYYFNKFFRTPFSTQNIPDGNIPFDFMSSTGRVKPTVTYCSGNDPEALGDLSSPEIKEILLSYFKEDVLDEHADIQDPPQAPQAETPGVSRPDVITDADVQGEQAADVGNASAEGGRRRDEEEVGASQDSLLQQLYEKLLEPAGLKILEDLEEFQSKNQPLGYQIPERPSLYNPPGSRPVFLSEFLKWLGVTRHEESSDEEEKEEEEGEEEGPDSYPRTSNQERRRRQRYPGNIHEASSRTYIKTAVSDRISSLDSAASVSLVEGTFLSQRDQQIKWPAAELEATTAMNMAGSDTRPRLPEDTSAGTLPTKDSTDDACTTKTDEAANETPPSGSPQSREAPISESSSKVFHKKYSIKEKLREREILEGLGRILCRKNDKTTDKKAANKAREDARLLCAKSVFGKQANKAQKREKEMKELNKTEKSIYKKCTKKFHPDDPGPSCKDDNLGRKNRSHRNGKHKLDQQKATTLVSRDDDAVKEDDIKGVEVYDRQETAAPRSARRSQSLMDAINHILDQITVDLLSQQFLEEVANFRDRNVSLKYKVPSTSHGVRLERARPLYLSQLLSLLKTLSPGKAPERLEESSSESSVESQNSSEQFRQAVSFPKNVRTAGSWSHLNVDRQEEMKSGSQSVPGKRISLSGNVVTVSTVPKPGALRKSVSYIISDASEIITEARPQVHEDTPASVPETQEEPLGFQSKVFHKRYSTEGKIREQEVLESWRRTVAKEKNLDLEYRVSLCRDESAEEDPTPAVNIFAKQAVKTRQREKEEEVFQREYKELFGEVPCAGLRYKTKEIVLDRDEGVGGGGGGGAVVGDIVVGDAVVGDAVVGDAVVGDVVVGDVVVGDAVVGDAVVGDAVVGDAVVGDNDVAGDDDVAGDGVVVVGDGGEEEDKDVVDNKAGEVELVDIPDSSTVGNVTVEVVSEGQGSKVIIGSEQSRKNIQGNGRNASPVQLLLQQTPVKSISQRVQTGVENFGDRNVPLKYAIPGSCEMYQPPEARPIYVSRDTKEKILSFLGLSQEENQDGAHETEPAYSGVGGHANKYFQTKQDGSPVKSHPARTEDRTFVDFLPNIKSNFLRSEFASHSEFRDYWPKRKPVGPTSSRAAASLDFSSKETKRTDSSLSPPDKKRPFQDLSRRSSNESVKSKRIFADKSVGKPKVHQPRSHSLESVKEESSGPRSDKKKIGELFRWIGKSIVENVALGRDLPPFLGLVEGIPESLAEDLGLNPKQRKDGGSGQEGKVNDKAGSYFSESFWRAFEESALGAITMKILDQVLEFGRRNIPLQFDAPKQEFLEMPNIARPMYISRKNWGAALDYLGLGVGDEESCESVTTSSDAKEAAAAVQGMGADGDDEGKKKQLAEGSDGADEEEQHPYVIRGTVECHRELTFSYPTIPLPTRFGSVVKPRQCNPYEHVCSRTCSGYFRQRSTLHKPPSVDHVCYRQPSQTKNRDVWCKSELNRSSNVDKNGRYYRKQLFRKRITVRNILAECKKSQTWTDLENNGNDTSDSEGHISSKTADSIDKTNRCPNYHPVPLCQGSASGNTNSISDRFCISPTTRLVDLSISPRLQCCTGCVFNHERFSHCRHGDPWAFPEPKQTLDLRSEAQGDCIRRTTPIPDYCSSNLYKYPLAVLNNAHTLLQSGKLNERTCAYFTGYGAWRKNAGGIPNNFSADAPYWKNGNPRRSLLSKNGLLYRKENQWEDALSRWRTDGYSGNQLPMTTTSEDVKGRISFSGATKGPIFTQQGDIQNKYTYTGINAQCPYKTNHYSDDCCKTPRLTLTTSRIVPSRKYY